MRPKLSLTFVIPGLLLLGACAGAAAESRVGAAAPGARRAPAAEAEIRAAADELVALPMRHRPQLAATAELAGARRDRLDDRSAAVLRQRHAEEDLLLGRLRAIDERALEGRASWALYHNLRESLEAEVGLRVCREELWDVNHLDGWLASLQRTARGLPTATDTARDPFGTLCGRRVRDDAAARAPAAPPTAAPTPQPSAATVPAARSPLVADVPGIARRFIDLPDARLQWLDFGGRGETVILLAGLGNNAWIFSDFGAALARQRFRVVALTRRGHGESEAPASGYALDTLVDDVVAFMDSLGVERAHLVGHSFAGAELTRLAAHHPDRVRRLVYFDAAYDRQAQLQWIGREPDSGTPPITPADRASPEAYLAYQRHARRGDLAQAWGPPIERDYLASLERTEDGAVRWRTPQLRYFEMLRAAGEAPPEYPAVRAPSLSVYALRIRSMGALSLAADAPAAMRDSVLAFERDVVGPWTDASIAQFRAGVGTGCVLNVDAIHHVFLQREREMVTLVRDFLRGRRVRCE